MLYAIVAVIALILDQLLKYWTTISVVLDTGQKNLIPGLIHLANVHNYGAAFSFLQGARWFFVILCLVFVAVVIYVLLKGIINTPGARWCAVIVMAGAIGNCIDRIINGYVVDMLEFDFKIFGMNFPVFNLADIYITLGVIAFCIFILVEKPGAGEDKAGTPSGAAARTTAAPPVKADSAAPASMAQSDKLPASGTPSESASRPERPAGQILEFPKQGGSTAQSREIRGLAGASDAPEGSAASPIPMEVVRPARDSSPRAGAAENHGGSVAVMERLDTAANTGETKTEQVMRMLVQGTGSASAPVSAAPRQAPPPAPAVQQPSPSAAPPRSDDDVSYDLDDILAEFRDL